MLRSLLGQQAALATTLDSAEQRARNPDKMAAEPVFWRPAADISTLECGLKLFSPVNNSQPQRFSDSSLLVRFQAGEDDAATALYNRYAARLMELANRSTGDDLSTRVDAEDIVQSVFRTFFRRASDGHYIIPEGEELWKLLLVIALNKVRSIAVRHRAAKRDVGQTRSMGQQDLEQPSHATEVLRMTIDDILVTLPEPHQRVVQARINGYEIGEIADQVSLSRRSVERILQSFRKRLRTTLKISE